MTLVLELLENRCLEGGFLLRAPCAAARLDSVSLDSGQHARCLFTAHHVDASIRPHPQKARRICAATHAIVTCTEAAADNHRELRHLCACHSGHHLRAMPCDAFVFVLAPDHEAADIL